MNKWPGASFLGSMHPADAQNKTLISNTARHSDQDNFNNNQADRASWSNNIKAIEILYKIFYHLE